MITTLHNFIAVMQCYTMLHISYIIFSLQLCSATRCYTSSQSAHKLKYKNRKSNKKQRKTNDKYREKQRSTHIFPTLFLPVVALGSCQLANFLPSAVFQAMPGDLCLSWFAKVILPSVCSIQTRPARATRVCR